LAVFGYPMSEENQERNRDTGQTYTTQYFERQRFELHPENAGTPYEVLLGRLGAQEAEQRGLLSSAPFLLVVNSPSPDGSCSYFPATQHWACGRFRLYWQNHGLEFGEPSFSFRESLALFGAPISEPFVDPASGFTTQYFERARFEYHLENRPPYAVPLSFRSSLLACSMRYYQRLS
jgi:spore germination protein